jgi:choice-of-anchor A domain-containing protein
MKRIILIALAAASAAGASAQVFGAAADYNAFVLNAYNGFNSDSEGRVAIGGNATLQNYDIGLLNPGGNALVVGGNLSFTNGTVRGNSVAGGSAAYSGVGFTNGGSAQSGTPINFGAASDYLMDVSEVWAALASSGSAQTQFGSLKLTGANANLNVFNINASQLQGISEVNINVPEGAGVIINVAGSNVTFPQIGYNYNGSQNREKFANVAWHLPDAKTVGMNSLNGTLFAPKAAVNGGFGAINGQLIAGSFNGPLQMNNVLYTANAPVPEPGLILGLGAAAAFMARRRRRA